MSPLEITQPDPMTPEQEAEIRETLATEVWSTPHTYNHAVALQSAGRDLLAALDRTRAERDEAQAALDELLKAAAGQGWVSVSERLPATGELVLLQGQRRDLTPVWGRLFDWGDGPFWKAEGLDYLLENYTHWYAVPPAP